MLSPKTQHIDRSSSIFPISTLCGGTPVALSGQKVQSSDLVEHCLLGVISPWRDLTVERLTAAIPVHPLAYKYGSCIAVTFV